MKFGIVMGTCIPHAMQAEAWRENRRWSRAGTEMVAIFNGTTPDACAALPIGVEAYQAESRFTEECDLWQCGFNIATAKGWDWCVFLHDDFKIFDSCVGWEAELEGVADWRVGMATWCPAQGIAANGNPFDTGRPGRLCCSLDSCSIGFRMSLFGPRGFFTDTRTNDRVSIQYGFGAFESMGWMFSQDHAIWHLQGETCHHWIYENARILTKAGAGGHQEVAARYRDVSFPAERWDEYHIKVCDRVVRIAP